jgi:hypothetical protein
MELLEEIVKAKANTIHKARLLYTLSRMEPEKATEQQKEAYQKFVATMYNWIQTKESVRELLSAIHLLIYSLREKV